MTRGGNTEKPKLSVPYAPGDEVLYKGAAWHVKKCIEKSDEFEVTLHNRATTQVIEHVSTKDLRPAEPLGVYGG